MERAQSVFGGTERGLKDKLADAERRAESYKGTVSFYVQKSNDLEAKLADLREEVRDLTELRDANEERLKGSDSGRRQSKAFADELRTKLAELKQSYIEEGRRIEQVLGRALGYPRYADDPKNFPDATDEDGVCVGDHVPITLAEEAAAKLAGRL
jgi:outer membrane protein TolC